MKQELFLAPLLLFTWAICKNNRQCKRTCRRPRRLSPTSTYHHQFWTSTPPPLELHPPHPTHFCFAKTLAFLSVALGKHRKRAREPRNLVNSLFLRRVQPFQACWGLFGAHSDRFLCTSQSWGRSRNCPKGPFLPNWRVSTQALVCEVPV